MMNRIVKLYFMFVLTLFVSSVYADINKILWDYRNGQYQKTDDELKEIMSAKQPEALYYFGLSCFYGYGFPLSVESGINYLSQSAEMGYLPAQKLLAKYYLLKKNDPEQALSWFLKGAGQGDVESQMFAAAAYLYGYGAKQNPEKARKQFIAAAVNGNSIAQYTLAEHFLDSKHASNHKLAVLWLKKSAEAGNYKSQLKLGELYYRGNVVEKNEQLAQAWFEKAGKLNKNATDELITRLKEPLTSESEDKSEKKKPVQLSREEAGKKASAWILNSEEPTKTFGNYKLDGILWDWNNTNSISKNSQNQSPKMPHLKKSSIIVDKFEIIDPKTIKMSEIIEIIGKQRYHHIPKNMTFPHYPVEFTSDDPEAVKKLVNLSEMGDAHSQFALAQLYHHGILVHKDDQQAFELFKKSAQQGHMKAEYNLGIMYLNGDGVAKNDQSAVEWLERSAFKGNVKAQYALGLINEYGVNNNDLQSNVNINMKRAKFMYGLAALNNLPEAQAKLANIRLSGEFNDQKSYPKLQAEHRENIQLYESAVKHGIKDAELALAYYYVDSKDKKKQEWAYNVAKKSEEMNDPYAVLLLAIIYDRGIGVDPDQSKALDYYKIAAEHNNSVADFILGSYYYTGNGVEKDVKKALSLLKKSALTQLPFSLYNLAVILHNDHHSEKFIPVLDKAIEQNHLKSKLLLADYYMQNNDDRAGMAQAVKIYYELAQIGYPDAQLKLGYIMENGINSTPRYDNAMKWYHESAKQGNLFAQFFLARMYQLGQVGEPNYKKARYWYQKAAEKDFVPAMIALGFINESMVHNYDEALKWYQKAADQNSPIAQYNLGLMYEYGKGRQVDYEKAFEYYEQASEKNYLPAQYNLALMYLQGTGVRKKVSKALKLFENIAANGDNLAQYQLAVMYENGIGITKDSSKAYQYYKQSADNGNVLARIVVKRIDEQKQADAERKEKEAANVKAEVKDKQSQKS